MLLWEVSDLHLELTRGWDLPSAGARPKFDVMVVAGDLIPRMERGVAWLRERVPDRPVIYVPGNHEGYGCDVDRTVAKAKQAAEGSKVMVLENEAVRIGDVTFAGATLWTDFKLFGDQRRAMVVAGERMNDFRKIRTARYAVRFRPQNLKSLGDAGARRDAISSGTRPGFRLIVCMNYLSARTEKPRSLLHSSERLPSSTVSSTTSWPHKRCR